MLPPLIYIHHLFTDVKVVLVVMVVLLMIVVLVMVVVMVVVVLLVIVLVMVVIVVPMLIGLSQYCQEILQTHVSCLTNLHQEVTLSYRIHHLLPLFLGTKQQDLGVASLGLE